ncbi:guanine nucleotide binding protein, alpha subunit [Russula vinacea]|nr:guanine nucleotide binding protein, alpha subunit [Russula vinacea]
MSYARQSWEAERMSWRTVIHLNLVRSVNKILAALENAPETETPGRGDEVHAAADTGIYRCPAEVCLRSQNGWAAALGFARQKTRSQGQSKRSLADEALEVILMSRDDMAALWGDDEVRGALDLRGVRLEDQSGFFLDDLYRIAHRGYEPTDDDIVRARLRTVGGEAGREWISTTSEGHDHTDRERGVWHPYFTDVKAIIFLAPISVFDEKLEGDPSVNLLEDSIKLWTTVCKSKLLSKVQLILFLNKCDILERKLARGVSLKRYIPSYGDRKNDLPTASKYLRNQFLEIARKQSPEPRTVHSFMTTAIDTRAMAKTLGAIRGSILNDNLQSAELLR